MRQTQKSNKKDSEKFLKKTALSLDMPKYELKCWIESVKITKNVEKCYKEGKDLMEAIRDEVQAFENKNSHLKRYIIVKVITHVFNSFGIKEKANSWLNRALERSSKEKNGLAFKK